MKLSTARALCFVALLIGSTNFVCAQSNTPPNMSGKSEADRPHREPPPQAYEDCKDKKEGVVVQITTPREGKINATCTASTKGLFARPEHPPHEHAGDHDKRGDMPPSQKK